MLTRSSVMSLVAGTAVVWAAAAYAQPLPSEPTLVTGKLENGLTYIVRRASNPPGRAVMWVHLYTGSLNETDQQRGIAHYLEHMAFNGSANFEPGSLVPYFQSLGMQFGRDQNAFTSFDQTTFQLSLPNVEDGTLGKGLTFFADVVGRLSLSPKEIESERGIIQEERRRGLSGRQRTAYYVLERMVPGSLYGLRIPIGTEETIGSVQEKDFRDYYGKWYGAGNATMIVVADTEPERVVKMLTETFSSLPKSERMQGQDVKVKAYDKSFAIVTSDPEVRSGSIRIVRVEPARTPTTTVPQLRDDLVSAIGQSAFNRRLSDKVSKGGTAYQGAFASMGNDSGVLYSAEVSARCDGDKWRASLDEVALDMQRARMFGFTAREIEQAKKDFKADLERAVETEGTLPASAIISRINGTIADGETIMAAKQQLDLFNQLAPSITTEEISARFAKELDPKAVAFIAVLPSGAEVPSEAQLLEAGTKALAAKPTAEAETAHATTLMDQAPKAGTVAKADEHAASHVWTAWLSNNVRVNYRFMDQRKNDVSVRISLIGGELLEDEKTRGLTRAAELAWGRAATKKLSSTDIRDLMTGKKVSVRGGGGMGGRGGRGGGGGGGPDSIGLSIGGSPEDLETGFQLAHLLLTEPKIEAPALDQYKTVTKQVLEEMDRNPMMLGSMLAASAPYPASDIRTQPLTEAQVDAITLEHAQAWLEKLIKESPIEVTIVGDLPKERAMELAATYLGSLPTREKVTPEAYMKLRTLEKHKGGHTISRDLETQTKQAFVYSGFYGADEKNLADVRALNLAARILSTRMVKEVREDAQLVYSISAGSRAGQTFPGFGTFAAAAPTDPAKADALTKKLSEMYAAFAKEGPTEEEMTVAKKQMATMLDEQMIEPGYWAGRLNEIGYRGASVDDILSTKEAYQAFTPAQVKTAFAKYYEPGTEIVVVVKPKAGAEAPAEKAEDGAKSKPSSN